MRSNDMALKVTVKIVFPIQMFVALFFLLRGHNEPGGGFIAGLISSVALVLSYISSDKNTEIRFLKLSSVQLIFMGLTLSLLAGIWGGLVHGSFLKSVWGPAIPLPLVGKVAIGSVLFFDLGVFFLVNGIVTQIIGVLKEDN